MTNAAQANKHDSDTLDMHSPNLVDDNVQKIMALFPNCITESEDENGKLKKAVDFDLLRQELSQSLVEGGQERYRLDWPGKRQAILEANSPIAKTLRPARDESVNFDTTENLFIEGDNLEALKLLQESYLGQVKMIYIDPPYNTGSDFIYEDDFSENTADFLERSEQVDEEGNLLIDSYERNSENNGRFHSDWLTMMYSRLKLARSLLSDDGVIFISIDDNEVHNLRKICDEIFGSNNFLTEICVEISKTQGMKVKAAQNGRIVKNHEYILVYSMDINKSFNDRLPLYDRTTIWDNHFSKVIIKDGSFYRTYSLSDYIVKNKPEILKLFVDHNLLEKNKVTSSSIEKGIIIDPKIRNFFYSDFADSIFQEMACSITLPKSLEEKLNTHEVVEYEKYLLTMSSGGKVRQYRSLDETINTSDEYKPLVERVTIRGALWKGFYSDMMNVAKEGDTEFKNGKKPLRLIAQLAKWVNRENGIVMDFFAGSSTTAHSIMHLNSQDGGTRKFIMVQLPERTEAKSEAFKAGFTNIAEISKERIRRAAQKILADNQDKDDIKDLDIGFRVLKIDSTNMKEVYYTPDEYSQAELDNLESHIKDGRTGEDLLFQVMLDWGVPLSLPIEVKDIQGSSVYYVGIDSLVACFDILTTDLIDEISKDKPLKFVSSELAIAHDQDKTNIKARFAQLSPDTQVKFI